jgi:hypothetical protein
MSKFFAVAHANGPISVAIDAETISQAAGWFAAQDTSFADDCRTDAEDALEIVGDGMSQSEFAAALETCGYSIADGNLCGDHNWTLWVKND